MTDVEILERLRNLAGEMCPESISEFRRPGPGDEWPLSRETVFNFISSTAPMLTGWPESDADLQATIDDAYQLVDAFARGEIQLVATDRPAMDFELICHGTPRLRRVLFDTFVARDRQIREAASRGERVCVCGRVLQEGEVCNVPGHPLRNE